MAGFLVVALLASVSPAEAAVTGSSTALPASVPAGQAVTFTWNKASSSPLDGTQTGSVQPVYSGASSGSMTAKAYSFPAQGSTVQTWTFRAPFPGSYSVNFVDTVSAGTAIVTSANYILTSGITVDWTAEIFPDGTHLCLSTNTPQLSVDGSANVYYGFGEVRQSGSCSAAIKGTDTRSLSFDLSGNLRWSGTSSASSGIDLRFGDLHYDNGGRLVSIECATDVSGLIFMEARAYRLSDGANIQLNVLTPGTLLTPTPTQCPLTGGSVSVKVDATHVDTYVQTFFENKMWKFNTDFTVLRWQTAITNPQAIGAKFGETYGLDITASGQAIAYNQATGVLGSGIAATGYSSPRHSQLTADKYLSILGGGPTMAAQSFAVGSGTAVGTPISFTPSQIVTGDTTKNSFPGAFNRDGQDRFLICGVYSDGGVNKPFVGVWSSAGAVQGWLNPITSPLPQASTLLNCDRLEVDSTGGFYVAWHLADAGGQFNVEQFVQHYSSVLTTAPVPEPVAVVPIPIPGGNATSTPPPFGGNGTSDVGSGLKGFVGATFGSSAGGLFLGGFVLVIIIVLAVSSAFSKLAKTDALATALAGSIAGMGMMVFNTISGLWLVWVGIVFVVLTLAVVAYSARKLIFRGQRG